MVRVTHSDSNRQIEFRNETGEIIEFVGESENIELIDGPIEWELDGDKYKIVRLVRYPSYDFLFGVPLTHNNMAPTEVGLFQVRFRDSRRASGYLLDQNELLEMISGLVKIHDYYEDINE